MDSKDLLEVRDLSKHFVARKGSLFGKIRVIAVDGVSLQLQEGGTLGLVGESGCGKTTLGRCILRLIEPTGGDVLFLGQSLLHLSKKELRHKRQHLQMVFQDPAESLNPTMTVGATLMEVLSLHTDLTLTEKRERVAELLPQVGLGTGHVTRLPYQLSGGQQQRVSIARAIAVNPRLLILDEPTSALDVSVQGQILQLLEKLRDSLKVSYVLITHNLSIVRNVCERVAVMYLGGLVEVGPVNDVFESPAHPYTQALLSAVPIPDPLRERQRLRLTGEVPSMLGTSPKGCRLYSRCPRRTPECMTCVPPPQQLGAHHTAACFHPG